MALASAWCAGLVAVRGAAAADIATREVTEALFKSTTDKPADFSGFDLSYLDLAGLDFKGARMPDADLYGTDLTGANLAGADLSHTRLDRSLIIKTDFTGANLEGATMLRPTVYSDMQFNQADAPNFSRARLVRLRVHARLDGAIFIGADLTDADFSPHEERAGAGTITTVPRNELTNADFSGAIMRSANFSQAKLSYVRFVHADLKGAKLRNTDLTGADFTGADLAGADLTGADLTRAKLKAAKGLDTVIGLGRSHNLDQAIR
ncbi:MAG: pentapeptide repeat-containing protein [Hyphomicrobiaceae bacterium]|nr:pentapeptide repeat-containing protein [Hyphomicrobiaceae bacterium]